MQLDAAELLRAIGARNDSDQQQINSCLSEVRETSITRESRVEAHTSPKEKGAAKRMENTLVSPTVDVPESIVKKYPNCYALLVDPGNRVAIVDPDSTPEANGRDIAYIRVGDKHAYISRYLIVNGCIFLNNHGIMLRKGEAEVAGKVIWFISDKRG